MKKKFNIKKNSIVCFSVIVTGRCNAKCSYCHFYGMRPDIEGQLRITDIDFELFKNYISLIKESIALFPKNTAVQIRFSGGEALVMGDYLFKLCDYTYKELNIKPYILTNGILINERSIKKALLSHVDYFVVSVENPISPDKFAPNPEKTISKIKQCNKAGIKALPGVVLIKNEEFKHIEKIVDYFIKEIGVIPTLNEMNFQAFKIPTKRELADLYKNLFLVFKKYYKTHQVVAFPYISPELSYAGKKHYLVELDLFNAISVNESNIKNKVDFVSDILNDSYENIECTKKCDWKDVCGDIKWLWFDTFGNMSKQKKLNAYCEMKNTINKAFIDALK